MMRRCVSCGIEKDETQFYKRGAHSYRTSCKTCWNTASKEWVFKHPERRAEIVKKYDDAHKDEKREYNQTRRVLDPRKALFMAAKNRAQKGGLPFTIELDDILIPEFCPVFGCPLQINPGLPGGGYNSPSLDKIDPVLGYVKGNIQVISLLANMMKGSASKEQLIQFANWIKDTYE